MSGEQGLGREIVGLTIDFWGLISLRDEKTGVSIGF